MICADLLGLSRREGADAMSTTYAYKVRDKAGRLVKGSLEAQSEQLVVAKLREMGYVPVSVTATRQVDARRWTIDDRPGQGRPEGRRRLLPAAGNDDRRLACRSSGRWRSWPSRPRSKPLVKVIARDAGRHRAGAVVLAGGRPAPQGVPARLPRHGPRRRDRRRCSTTS